MEAIAFNRIADKKAFNNAATAVGFDNFVLLKWLYILEQAEIDVLPVLGDDLLSILVYGWRIFQKHMDVKAESVNSGQVVYFVNDDIMILKVLTQCTLDLWFSREWLTCALEYREGLVVCLSRSLSLLKSMAEFAPLNWDYLSKLGDDPWQLHYWQRQRERSKATEVDTPHHDPVWDFTDTEIAEDIAFFKKESIYLVLLRLVKLFDAGHMDQVSNLSMRVIVACYSTYDQTMADFSGLDGRFTSEWKCCLLFACHIHLMAIFERDNVNGSKMDLMMHDIRLFWKWQQADAAETRPIVKSVACYVPLITRKMGFHLNDFYYGFVTYQFRDMYRSLYGIVSQAYKSYILANILVELNDDTLDNGCGDFYQTVFRRTFGMYVSERENSDQCLDSEIQRQKRRRRKDRKTNALVQSMNGYRAKLSRGNRTHRSLEGAPQPDDEMFLEPVFQSMPKNPEMLKHVYGVLKPRHYVGWKTAKIMLLIKIISYEFNMIELWRYHPGLTVDFMISLDVQLAQYMSDLAALCQSHALIEQELWLSAFCLNPIEEYYKPVVRCGVRNMRRAQAPGQPTGRRAVQSDTVDTKYALYSSVVDVKRLVAMTDYETSPSDYDALAAALKKLQLPDSLVQDLTTINFQSRNKMFTWSVNWTDLRQLCRDFMKHPQKKRTFVEMNMSEANERLQYLDVDYEKYRHRPQLDYGTIEKGYEDALAPDDDDGEYEEPVVVQPKPKPKKNGRVARRYFYDEDDEDDDDDDEYDSTVGKSSRRGTAKLDEKYEELSQDAFLNTVRTRARTAAIIKEYTRTKEQSPQAKPPDSQQEPTPPEGRSKPPPPTALSDYENDTEGFPGFPNIWDDVDPKRDTVLPTTLAKSAPFLSAVDVDKVFASHRQLIRRKYDMSLELSDSSEEEEFVNVVDLTKPRPCVIQEKQRTRNAVLKPEEPPTMSRNDEYLKRLTRRLLEDEDEDTTDQGQAQPDGAAVGPTPVSDSSDVVELDDVENSVLEANHRAHVQPDAVPKKPAPKVLITEHLIIRGPDQKVPVQKDPPPKVLITEHLIIKGPDQKDPVLNPMQKNTEQMDIAQKDPTEKDPVQMESVQKDVYITQQHLSKDPVQKDTTEKDPAQKDSVPHVHITQQHINKDPVQNGPAQKNPSQTDPVLKDSALKDLVHVPQHHVNRVTVHDVPVQKDPVQKEDPIHNFAVHREQARGNTMIKLPTTSVKALESRVEWCVQHPRKLVEYPTTDEEDEAEEEAEANVGQMQQALQPQSSAVLDHGLSEDALLKMFTRTKLIVKVRRLSAADLVNLRKPCVPLKRLKLTSVHAPNEATKPPPQESPTSSSTGTASDADGPKRPPSRKARGKSTKTCDPVLPSSDTEDSTASLRKRGKPSAATQKMGPMSRLVVPMVVSRSKTQESIATKSGRFCTIAAELWKPPSTSALSNIYTKYGPVIEAPAPEMVSDPLSMEDDNEL